MTNTRVPISTLALPLRLGLIGPDQAQPCGIRDYTNRLAQALRTRVTLITVPFRSALKAGSASDENHPELLDSCDAILVQYERSLVPDRNFLFSLGNKYPNRVFVVPHEVYDTDPFAFPYASLQATFFPLLWLKRQVYKLRHQDYAQEKQLQAQGYGAHGVFPLSEPGAAILKKLGSNKILATIPLAPYTPQRVSQTETLQKEVIALPHGAQFGIAVFGFLNPGLDYFQLFDLVERLDKNVALMLLGGGRSQEKGESGHGIEAQVSAEVERRGLTHRVQVTGFLEEEVLSRYFALCDMFICPMRFKSNSSSILNLLYLKKPIFVSDIPLTQYLYREGAPLSLYTDLEDLLSQVKKALKGQIAIRENKYPWTLDKVAEAYISEIKKRL